MSKDSFEVILLMGRTVSGKSEIIYFPNHTNTEDRRRRFHVDELDVRR